ncbi:SARP family transcriptional regulator [Pseudonocardia asaccharolytica DSM 44247 = NBRC 16224]|uniref:SARP family transcriptional regulator n=1 Tax=Pseudonocardia asaccharolytica DSM 44247 = NBRC 16224 TaxID=1123024 RepID=A0A511D525_9PSEU|nr:SARP family transcriptional regulator [Pseudonocardia asaccharolytica DSM 44247 = NBRC 16224]
MVTAIGVLGPLELHGPDGPIRAGSARQRRLLAALAAHADTAVSTGVLAELVWDEPPAHPVGGVQTVVARLRRLLPPQVGIATTPEGYRLTAARADIDATAFADHLAAAAAAGDATERLRLLEAALRLWRGRPYPELDHPSVEPEVARLAELRSAAAEQHVAALLSTGRAGEAVAAGEALVRAEPLRESAVALLARVLVAAGRQSDALACLTRLRSRLAEDLGLDPAPELRSLEQQVLRQELEPVARDAAPQAGRPVRVPASAFIGRDDDVARVAALLGDRRIVTLCGAGGVGKTRLATHVAAEVAGRYADGVVVVALGDGGPSDVAPALAAALRLADDGGAGSAVVDRAVRMLAVRAQLLVLDNCEHVADEVAALVEAVVTGTDGVDVLATSREPLRVDAEFVVPVQPLDPPAAAELLIDRMRAAGAGVDGPTELVTALCRRLDGLPLALELAAARAPALGLAGLMEAMDRPFEVLRGGQRTASARHRSLRDVVAWSYGLLDDVQRLLFDRLAVFVGPVEHAAIAAVCGPTDALPDLVDRSLVVRVPGEPARFGMLETLRAFGRSRLAADPAGTELRARHAAWALRLVEEVMADRQGRDEPAAVGRFDAHLADLRRAHAWLCESGPVDDLLRLTVPFGRLGYLRARADLMLVVERTLDEVGALGPAPPVTAHPLVARLLGQLATARWRRGDMADAEAVAGRAVAVAGAAGNPTAARDAHWALSEVCSFRGDLAAGLRHARRACELAARAGDRETLVMAAVDPVLESAYAGDDAAAEHESALADLAGHSEAPTVRAWLAYARGERRAATGDARAVRYLKEAVALAEEAGSDFVAGLARHTLLTTAARAGDDPVAALTAFGPLIDHWHAHGAWAQLWIAMRALVEALSRLGRHRDVAVLLGASRASPLAPQAYGADFARVRSAERAARAALGPAFTEAVAEGAALGDAGAVTYARRLTAPIRSSTGWSTTARSRSRRHSPATPPVPP